MPVGSALIEEFRGVNLSEHPLRLEDDELVFALNTYPVQRGMPDLRPNGRLIGISGDAVEGSVAAADLAMANNCGLVQFFDILGRHHLLVWQFRADTTTTGVFRMRELLDFNMDGNAAANIALPSRQVYLKPAGAGGVDDATRADLNVALVDFQRPGFTVRNGKLYIFIGVGNPLVLEAGVQDSISGAQGGAGSQNSYWGATEVPWNVAVAGTAAQYINGTTATVKDNQVVLAGVKGYPCKLFTADPTDAGNFTAVAPITSSIDIGTTDDPIVAVVTVPVLGGADAIEPYLLVLKRHSVWMVQGPLPDSTSRGDVRVVPLMRAEGCVSKLTVVETPKGIVWCSGQNVYIMEPGNNPRAIGDNISPYLKTLESAPDNPAWHGAWDMTLGCYRLSVPRGMTSDAFAAFELAGTGPATYPAEQWWCDIRKPAEPAWWGPMSLSGVTHSLEYREPGGPLIGTWMPIDTNSGGIAITVAPHLCALGDHADGNRDWTDYYDATRSMNPWQEVRTKVFDMGDPFIEKLVEALELFFSCSPTLNTEFSVYAYATVNMRPFNRALIRTGTDATDDGDFTLVLDTGKLDEKGFGEGFHALALTPQNYPTVSQRVPARTFQFHILCANVKGGVIRPRMRLAAAGIRVRPVGRRSTGHDGH